MATERSGIFHAMPVPDLRGITLMFRAHNANIATTRADIRRGTFAGVTGTESPRLRKPSRAAYGVLVRRILTAKWKVDG